MAKHNGFNTLPPADTTRWVVRRKAQVVNAVRRGVLSLDQALERYSLSQEEYESWERAIDKFGTKGLKATKIQNYRDIESITKTKELVEQAYEDVVRAE